MPTYQYACTECGHAFDQAQSFTDDALTACPECQGRLRKLFNAVGVVFKGSGFYRTDSREKPAEGGSTKTETTTAAKTDTGTSTSAGSSGSPASTGSNGSSTGSSASGSSATKSAQPAPS